MKQIIIFDLDGTLVDSSDDIVASINYVRVQKGLKKLEKEERLDYTDKADAIREHDCIWCMACVSVCPPQAVLVDQGLQEFHEKAAGTYQTLGSGQANPHSDHAAPPSKGIV